MQIIPMKDLKDTVGIERRCKESGEPVFITKNGYGSLVVMDIVAYEKTIRDIYEAGLVNEAIDALADGALLIDGNKIKERTMARYDRQ